MSAFVFESKPEVVTVRESAHFAEAAVFGGRPHKRPAWFCGIFHKRHFISCWSGAPGWGSHVHCGYCQRCRHFANDKLRYNWMPSDAKPHTFHIRTWTNGQSQIETNELYLHEIFDLIEMLSTHERDTPLSNGNGELHLTMTTTGGGCSYNYTTFNLDKRARLRVLSHLFIIYRHALDGTTALPVERRWWHRLSEV